jgi:hypothetical protein
MALREQGLNASIITPQGAGESRKGDAALFS